MKDPFKKRYKIYRKMPRLTESIRGSLVIMQRYCGKSNCRCRKGLKHKSTYLSQRHKGKTRMIYIPHPMEGKVKEYIRNYQDTKTLLNKISDLNIKLIAERRLRP